ncbi:Rieske (2Fe-2S) protein [Mucilaginibacter sp. KACC 22063]|uniref:Rieske (2Fe-2S) protein n=1 Tax=Mucilaginibacter sp. KACC 22063 TaxID=3025666 RepID=UPI0023669251|nr:Rieske 2Fe-2S domain-containing protein [Mucilaginibacter sp. KACC 22063]WDF53460.1 Rieske 2Fe-2S domain-containing protein [Mucilaginibacter sp. KACC 22063]
MKWLQVGEVGDFEKITKIEVAGKKLCVINYGGELFALASKCPHAGADLSKGWCEKGKLICPYHRYSYDLLTGRGSEGQNDFVNTYPVKVENNYIFIGISSFWETFMNIFTS